jgi:hypothetical protein
MLAFVGNIKGKLLGPAQLYEALRAKGGLGA